MSRAEWGEFLCEGCITNFDVATHTFTGTFDADDLRKLPTGARVAVVFSDDDLAYTFTVAEGGASDGSSALGGMTPCKSDGLEHQLRQGASAS